MYTKSHLLLCSFVVFMILTPSLPSVTEQSLGIAEPDQKLISANTGMMSYAPHSPIVISSNVDFELQGWPGNGTKNEPYVIEDLNITSTEPGISISNTSACFEVRNCIISSTVQSSNAGLVLKDVSNGTVRDTIVLRHYYGVYLENSSRSILTSNTADDNSLFGFYLHYSGYSTLVDNTASGNTRYGFYMRYSESCTLVNNTALANHYHGFCLLHSASCILVNNTAQSNYYHGFYLGSSELCILTNNTAYANSYYGFYVVSSDLCRMAGNTATDNVNGFCVLDSESCRFTGNAGTDNGIGFSLYYSESCNLTLNIATGNSQYGIYFGTSSFHNAIYQNLIGYNGVSNALDNGGYNSWDDGASLGNYWSDYNGTGAYSISGSAGSLDRFPFRMNTTTTAITETGTGFPLQEALPVIFAGGLAIMILIAVVRVRRQRTVH